MGNIGYSTLTVMPSARGFGAALSKDINPQLAGAGTDGGKHFGSGMLASAKSFVGPIAALFAAKIGVDFFKDAISGASDLSESASKVGVVFGEQSAQIMAASKTSAKAMGLSASAYLDATGSLGNLLVSLKVAPGAAADMSQEMVKLAGDMASFNNVSPEEALLAIRSGLTGETEPLKRFGVNMNDATLKAEAFKLGLISATTDAMDPQTKALAAQSLIMSQTTTAQGDFARTSGGLANQQRILAAQTEDLKTKIGGALLPVVTGITVEFNKFVTGMQDGTGAGGKFRDIAVRIKDAAQGLFDLMVKGDFTSTFRNAFNLEEDSTAVAILFAIRDGAISLIGFVTGTAIPAVQGFIKEFKNGTGVGGGFKDFLVLLYNNAVKPIADFIIGTAIPAVQNFIQQFKNGEGAGGKFRDVLTTIWNKGLVPLFNFITTTALPALKTVETWILANVIPAINAWAAAMSWMWTNVYSPVINFIVGAIQVWAAAAGWLWTNILSPYITAFTTLWSWMWSNVIKPVVDFIVGYFQLMGAVWSWVWTNVLSPTIQALATAFTWVKDRIGDNFNLIKSIVSGAADTIKSNFQTVIDFFRDAPGQIGGFFSRIGDTISGVFKKAFNGIASLWNNTVGKLSFTIPDIPGMPGRGDKIVMPKIPTMLDKGGLVTSPTLAIIGERRPEVVIPLEELGKYTGGGGKAQVINIYGVQSIDQIVAELPRLQYRGAA